jgi:molecular chaperone HtpG
MPEGQKHIYFGSSSSKEAIAAMPQMDLLKKKGFDVLVFTDEIDEFMANILREYEKKEFKSINQGDLDLLDDAEKVEISEKTEQSKDLLETIKGILASEVKDVKLSTRLTDSPVCLVSGDGLSFEMEKVMNQMPGDKAMKADKILEINPKHELFAAIEKLHKNKEDLEDYAWILYNQALLIEGLKIKDPVGFANKMVKLMVKSIR